MDVLAPPRSSPVPVPIGPGVGVSPRVVERVEIDPGQGFLLDHLSGDIKKWIESSLISMIVNMLLMIMAGLFFSPQPQEQGAFEVVLATDELPTLIETIEQPPLPVLAAVTAETKNNVLGSTTDAVANIDFKQTTLAGAKGGVDTMDFALNGAAASDKSGQGRAAAGVGNGIGDILGGAFGERIMKSGAKTGDVQITLIWNDRNDLDLHVMTPLGEEISFMRPFSKCGGKLDVDRNRSPFDTTKTPIENVFWPKGRGPVGDYRVLVKYYANYEDERRPVPFELAVKVNGEVVTFEGEVSQPGQVFEVTTFTKGKAAPKKAAPKNVPPKK